MKEFENVMAERTDRQLAEIVTIHRDGYKPEAIEAAEKEIKKRQLNIRDFISTEEEQKNKSEEQDKSITGLTLLQKIGVFLLGFAVTGVFSFVFAEDMHDPVFKILPLILVIGTQVGIYQYLKHKKQTDKMNDFKLWTLNFYIAAIILFILQMVLSKL